MLLQQYRYPTKEMAEAPSASILSVYIGLGEADDDLGHNVGEGGEEKGDRDGLGDFHDWLSFGVVPDWTLHYTLWAENVKRKMGDFRFRLKRPTLPRAGTIGAEQ